MKAVLFWIVVGVGAAGVVGSEVINNVNNNVCDKGPDANTISTDTKITVDPCPQEPCELHKGSPVTITIKFTPHLQGDEVLTSLRSTLAVLNGDQETVLGDMNQNACAFYMDCPLKNDIENTFSATFTFGNTLNPGKYDLKLKIQEFRGGSRVIVCQLFSVQLTGFNEISQHETFVLEFIPS